MKIFREDRFLRVEGDEFRFSMFMEPDGLPALSGEFVEMSDLSEEARKEIEKERKLGRELHEIRAEKAQKERALADRIAEAKWTVITGHRSRCAGLAPDEEIFFDTLTHGAGVIISVLRGGHDIKREGSRRDVQHTANIQDILENFDPLAKIVGDKILTKNPGAVIGKQARRIKFLSQIAGRRLSVK